MSINLRGSRIIYKVLYGIGDFIRGIMFKLDWYICEKNGIKGEDMYEKSVENLSAKRIICDIYEN
jgi:hypothetical protein